MTNNIYRIVLAGLLTTGLGACKKSFLEVVPKGTLIANATDDYSRLLSNATLMNVTTNPQVILSDEIAAVKSFLDNGTTREQRLFRWEDEVYEPEENAPELDATMTNIYLFNKVINEVSASVGGTEMQRRNLRAEALTGRAWTYFMLINYYRKPYQASSAAQDPGFPLVYTSDVTRTEFLRGTVQDVYKQIVDDLETAIPDLPVKLTARARMSRALGKALLGKVYMFMHQFDKALPLLNGAFDDLTQSALQIRLYNYNQTFATGGSFLPILALGGPTYPTIGVNEESFYGKQFTNLYAYFNNSFVITPETADLFKLSDLRLKFYVSTAYPSGALPSRTLRRTGPNLTQIGFVLPDLYLLRAECKARANDLTGAVEDVETLRKNRMPDANKAVPSDTASDKMKLLHFILQERVREFAVQGYRWFDMRRLSVDPLFTGMKFTHKVYATDGTFASYELKPERMVLRFPKKVMEQNPTMQNNP